MTMTDQRRQWLRGAYLDRIIEVAQTYAGGHTQFVDSEWAAFVGDEFSYLTELTAADQEYLRELAAFDALRRIRSDEYPPESADILRGMDPVRPRPTQHVTGPLRSTPLGIRIDDDTWSREGREQELLVEFGWHIQDAVNGAAVKEEYLDNYVLGEVTGWREYAAQPLTESDEEFLVGYLRGLIDEEYAHIKNSK